MDRDIESLVKSCKGCALAAEAPPIKFNPWPETDHPWLCLHIDFAGPLNGSYYLIIVDSFFKWPEILRCKKPITIGFLHGLFVRFGVTDSIVSDNVTQFTSKEFKTFCKMSVVKLITIVPYHSRSNGQAEWFVDTIKRALKKSNFGSMEAALQQFLQMYWLTPNKNIPSAMTLAEIMFALEIRSVFDNLIFNKETVKHTAQKTGNKFYEVLFNTFDVPIPQKNPETKRSKRKRRDTERIDISPKRKKILTLC